jgi:hypothetical protein
MGVRRPRFSPANCANLVTVNISSLLTSLISRDTITPPSSCVPAQVEGAVTPQWLTCFDVATSPDDVVRVEKFS